MINRWAKFPILLLLVLFSVLGCSSDSSNESDSKNKVPRGVTAEEAQLFSTALYNNAVDKNATFQMASGVLGSNGFRVQGKVDWINSIVEINVSLFVENQIDMSNISSSEQVFESFLGMTSLTRQAGLQDKYWIAREFNPDSYATDVLTQFVAKLASQTPDNPLLLKQNGAKFLGEEKVEGVETKKFQNTPNLTYFLTKDGELKKVNARIGGFPNEINITFSDRGSTSIDVPRNEDAFTIDEVKSFYPEKRPAF